jgi:ATP-dependent Clp protease, protease subunit
MTNGQPAGNVVPPEIYCLFAGMIDQLAVQRFHNAFALAGANRVKHLHLLFQCSGGLIGDGISLYNLFRVAPIELTLYNVGSVSSIGVIVYLGAKNRKTSQYGSFMIHRAFVSPPMATSDKLTAAAGQMLIDDDRTESILKMHTKIPKDKWDLHKFADVWFSAKEAIEFGIADSIAEFSPPQGTQIYNVWPPQN